MSSAYRAAALLAVSSALMAADFRVCADPTNLPYSNHNEQGFENAQSMRGGIDAWSRRVDQKVPVY